MFYGLYLGHESVAVTTGSGRCCNVSSDLNDTLEPIEWKGETRSHSSKNSTKITCTGRPGSRRGEFGDQTRNPGGCGRCGRWSRSGWFGVWNFGRAQWTGKTFKEYLSRKRRTHTWRNHRRKSRRLFRTPYDSSFTLSTCVSTDPHPRKG